MKQFELIICGFGGQGVLFAGELLGKAAVLSGKEVAQSSSYGSESRGSACHASVVLANEWIAYPKVRTPDLLIAISQPGYDKFAVKVKPGGKILFDSDLVVTVEIAGVEQIPVRATGIAMELGKRGVANVVMVATAVALTGMIDKQSLENTLTEKSPADYLEWNRKALLAGFQLTEEFQNG